MENFTMAKHDYADESFVGDAAPSSFSSISVNDIPSFSPCIDLLEFILHTRPVQNCRAKMNTNGGM